jgi:hypothetical protein
MKVQIFWVKNVVSIDKEFPAFRWTLLLPSSGRKMHQKSGLLEL